MDALGISIVSVGGKTNFEKFIKLSTSFGIKSTILIDNDRDHDDNHEDLVDSLNESADNLVELPADLEDSLLSSASNQVFCDALNEVSDQSKQPANLESAIDNDPHRTRSEIMRDWFDETNCSKPAFNRALANKLGNEDVPSDIEKAITKATKLAR